MHATSYIPSPLGCIELKDSADIASMTAHTVAMLCSCWLDDALKPEKKDPIYSVLLGTILILSEIATIKWV